MYGRHLTIDMLQYFWKCANRFYCECTRTVLTIVLDIQEEAASKVVRQFQESLKTQESLQTKEQWRKENK
jgi:hypothetical protein